MALKISRFWLLMAMSLLAGLFAQSVLMWLTGDLPWAKSFMGIIIVAVTTWTLLADERWLTWFMLFGGISLWLVSQFVELRELRGVDGGVVIYFVGATLFCSAFARATVH